MLERLDPDPEFWEGCQGGAASAEGDGTARSRLVGIFMHFQVGSSFSFALTATDELLAVKPLATN